MKTRMAALMRGPMVLLGDNLELIRDFRRADGWRTALGGIGDDESAKALVGRRTGT